MADRKITITLDEHYIDEIDGLVEKHVFESRSQAIQEAVGEKLMRLKHTRLAEESTKLEPEIEKAMSEEGIEKDMKEWPEN